MSAARVSLLATCALAIALGPLIGPRAVRADDRTPEQIAGAYLEALARGEMTTTGGLFDPEAVAQIKRILLPALQVEDEQGQQAIRRVLFPAAETLAEVKALSPVEFYNGFMRLVEAQAAQTGVRVTGGEIIGSVPEGDDVVHVVTRVNVGAERGGIQTMDVLTLTRTVDGWRIVLKADIEGLANAIRERVTPTQTAAPAR